MGNSCCVNSSVEVVEPPTENNETEQRPLHANSCPDPLVYDLVRRNNPNYPTKTGGQHKLLYKKGKLQPPPSSSSAETTSTTTTTTTTTISNNLTTFVVDPNKSQEKQQKTRLVLRKPESQSHNIYAIRSHPTVPPPPPTTVIEQVLLLEQRPEQRQEQEKPDIIIPDLTIDPYIPQHMSQEPRGQVNDWVVVSEDLDIYICDTGLSHAECDSLVQTTEQACKGHYAAYTYAKQTLGCREFPILAHACWDAVSRVTHIIWKTFPASQILQLDDREPHIVKYDVTKKERQKLDMHTDKSEWTFLIALSDGCGLDYEGGGTYFEALDATVHVQRGHALIFPGKLRHCGQRITNGLRFLLVGFLVDKANQASLFKDFSEPAGVDA